MTALTYEYTHTYVIHINMNIIVYDRDVSVWEHIFHVWLHRTDQTWGTRDHQFILGMCSK